MTTKKQIQANRKNAKLSTGPKTDEGKQRCAQNALKHGLRSQHPVIPGEDPAEYQHKLDQLRADIKPMNALEDDLVEQIADTSWRLKRLSRIEAAIERYRLEHAADKTSNIFKDDEQLVGDGFTGYGRLGLPQQTQPLRGATFKALPSRHERTPRSASQLRTNLLPKTSDARTRSRGARVAQESPPTTTGPDPTGSGRRRRKREASEQSDIKLTAPNGMTWDEFDELPPDQAVEAIRKQLKVVMPELGQPGPQEAQK